ncbi:hypothetical protein ElyMa_005735300 [Elysia marginata]|uniref:Uncharacterized protein n=1 Tax=Elysia marginata TaxID=1093978 RepID=A0AAV4FK11_9GAST|nr:hypothetical protein ElyMa_005735300 [Elysia marginata]
MVFGSLFFWPFTSGHTWQLSYQAFGISWALMWILFSTIQISEIEVWSESAVDAPSPLFTLVHAARPFTSIFSSSTVLAILCYACTVHHTSHQQIFLSSPPAVQLHS